MKIEKKQEIKKPIITHNKKLFYIIIILFILLIALVFYIRYLENKKLQNSECTINSDCVPSSCCHATSCTSKSLSPVCENIACTLNCEPNSLDCGQASCTCIQGKCGVK